MLAGLLAIQRQMDDLEKLLELPITSEDELTEVSVYYLSWCHVTRCLLAELFPDDERLAWLDAYEAAPDEDLDLAVDRLHRAATTNLGMLADIEDSYSEALAA